MLSPTAKTVAFKDHIEATVDLNIPIDTCNSLEAYVDYLAATIAVAARRATHPPHQARHTTARTAPILSLKARELLSHKRRLRRRYIATGDPSIKQLYSSTTNKLHRLLARTRRENLIPCWRVLAQITTAIFRYGGSQEVSIDIRCFNLLSRVTTASSLRRTMKKRGHLLRT